MEESTISLVVSVVALLISIISIYLTRRQPIKKTPAPVDPAIRPLQLQAYERLVLLCERIAIPNLISRTAQPELSAKEMQVVLLESIKQEFEYNTSQQIYVSPAAWDAVRSLKDQNMLIINQVANTLPPDAKGTGLNKLLLEFIINQKESALHTIVLNALNFEAKKVMQ